jgi:hypothetical protein
VTVSGVATYEAGHALGTGRFRRAAAISGAPRGSGRGVPAVTGTLSATGASSGMQTFAHTSHETRPRSVTVVPGAAASDTVIGIGSTTPFS